MRADHVLLFMDNGQVRRYLSSLGLDSHWHQARRAGRQTAKADEPYHWMLLCHLQRADGTTDGLLFRGSEGFPQQEDNGQALIVVRDLSQNGATFERLYRRLAGTPASPQIALVAPSEFQWRQN